MTDIRWIVVPDTATKAPMPEPTFLLYVSATDVLANLHRPDDLAKAIEQVLARTAPAPDCPESP